MFAASPAGLIPNAFASMYGSTKAFLQEYAASIAAELKPRGVDVLAFFPSPTATRYTSAECGWERAAAWTARVGELAGRV